jgi:hypothetical protein
MRRYFVFSLLLFVSLIDLACAADPGECGTPEAITAKLKGEDQHTIAFAQHLAPEKVIRGMMFTVNTDRTVGYILQADKRIGERASKICVWNRLANVRVFDARNGIVPPEALLKAPENDAFHRCDELDKQGKVSRSSCGSLNAALQKGAQWNEGIVLQGFAAKKQPDGSYVATASLATFQAKIGGKLSDDPNNPARAVGAVLYYSSVPDGASFINAVLAETEYTPYGLAALAQTKR